MPEATGLLINLTDLIHQDNPLFHLILFESEAGAAGDLVKRRTATAQIFMTPASTCFHL